MTAVPTSSPARTIKTRDVRRRMFRAARRAKRGRPARTTAARTIPTRTARAARSATAIASGPPGLLDDLAVPHPEDAMGPRAHDRVVGDEDERLALFASSSIPCRETPSIRTSPDVRSSRPEKQLRSVVLPHPEGPMIATISPFGIARFTPRSAWTVTAPELYTLWASIPRMIGSSAMGRFRWPASVFSVSQPTFLFSEGREEVERPRVLDPAFRLRKAESRRELRPESIALLRRHLAQFPLGPAERCREGQQLIEISELDRERFRRRFRPV